MKNKKTLRKTRPSLLQVITIIALTLLMTFLFTQYSFASSEDTDQNSQIMLTSIRASYTFGADSASEAIDGIKDYSSVPGNRWTCYTSGNSSDWYEIDLKLLKFINKVKVYFYDDGGGVKAPSSYNIEYWNGSTWAPVNNVMKNPLTPTGNVCNEVSFSTVSTQKVRIVLNHTPGSYSGFTEIELFSPDTEQPNTVEPNKIPLTLVSASYTFGDDNVLEAIDGITNYSPSPHNRWTCYSSGNSSDWYEINFMSLTNINKVKVYFYDDGGGVKAPSSYNIQFWSGSTWIPVSNEIKNPLTPTGNACNEVSFDAVNTSKVRIVLNHKPGSFSGFTEIEVFNSSTDEPDIEEPVKIPLTSIRASYTYWADSSLEAIDGIKDYSSAPGNRWTCYTSGNSSDWYEIGLKLLKFINKVKVYFYDDGGGVKAPSSYNIEYWNGSTWAPVNNVMKNPLTPTGNVCNEVSFSTVSTQKVRIVLNHTPGSYSGFTEIELFSADTEQPNKIPLTLVSASYTFGDDNVLEAIDGITNYSPSPHNRWTCYSSGNSSDWYEINFMSLTKISKVKVYFYDDGGGVKAPSSYNIQFWSGSTWVSVSNEIKNPLTPTGNACNEVSFDAVNTSKVRIVLNHKPGSFSGFTEIEVYCQGTGNLDQSITGMINNMQRLVNLANQYKQSNGVNTSANELVLHYIRRGARYSVENWPTVAGQIDSGFISYVNTNASDLTSYFNDNVIINDPLTHNDVDFVHWAATLNGLLYDTGWSDAGYKSLIGEGHIDNLCGWAGDLQTFLIMVIEETNNSNDYNYLYSKASELMGASGSSFSMDDLLADTDAFNISNNLGSSLASSFSAYYTSGNTTRYTDFTGNRDKEAIRDLAGVYTNEWLVWPITKWPLLDGITATDNQSNAVRDAFTDFIWNKIQSE